jgi:hypothetical protein
MTQRPLRAVSEPEKPAPRQPRPPRSLQQAAKQSERALLLRLRDTLLRKIDSDSVPTHALAAMTKRVMELDREIRAIDARAERDARDGQTSGDSGDPAGHAWDLGDI